VNRPLTAAVAAALLCGVSAPAHATLICGAPHQIIGKAGANPVVSTTVYRDGVNWSVVHTLANGRTIDRSTQYNMTDASDQYSAWSGYSLKNHDLRMHAELVPQADGRTVYYNETLHDEKRDEVVMYSETACTRYETPTYSPPVVASTPAPAPTYAPAPATMDRVPITFGKGGAYVAVSIGTMAANMLVDTGATGMTVSETIANWLVANGQATIGSTDHATLAGGVQKDFRGIDIGSVTVGGHVVRNVHAGVVPDGADMLLGLGVLAQVSPKFTVNVPTSTLDFN
jgi:predicted aspartyl protease